MEIDQNKALVMFKFLCHISVFRFILTNFIMIDKTFTQPDFYTFWRYPMMHIIFQILRNKRMLIGSLLGTRYQDLKNSFQPTSYTDVKMKIHGSLIMPCSFMGGAKS